MSFLKKKDLSVVVVDVDEKRQIKTSTKLNLFLVRENL
jgi:hypothetical protein